MDITIQIRHDDDGVTEEVQATLTRGGDRLNIHPKKPFNLSERDVLMLDEENLRLALAD